MSIAQQNTTQNRWKRSVVCNLSMSLYIFNFSEPKLQKYSLLTLLFHAIKQYERDPLAYKAVNSMQSPSWQCRVSPHSITSTAQMHFFSQLNNSMFTNDAHLHVRCRFGKPKYKHRRIIKS